MHFGVDYYPEHWLEERWEKDAKLMNEAHFDTVRLAEFAWSKIEKNEAQFYFTWLKKAIDTLSQQGLRIVLGTPTAAPPPWLTEKHPEVLPVNKDNEVVGPGRRRHYCVNSRIYRYYTKRIVSKLAEVFGDDERVIGWQIDNEYGRPVCYCQDCRKHFHIWLKKKYQGLKELNERWGTTFWSHEYTRWEQIPLPNENPRYGPNPSLHLDYKRFFSQSIIEYNKLQVDILKDKTNNQWVCHNFEPPFPTFDHFEMSEDLDLAAWDHYPTELRESYHEVSAGHDLTYSFKEEPFWVMEQQCSHLTRENLTPQPRPGEVRMWTYQSIAHGADGILYFRWRPCRFGDEQFHGGILRHDGSRESPKYKEIKSIGSELKEIEEEIDDTVVHSNVGIMFSRQQKWSQETYRFHSPWNYREEFMSYYKALFDANVNIKFVTEKSDFKNLDLLIFPALPMVNQTLKNKLEEFVQSGGVAVITYQSGIKDYDNVVTRKTFPGRLSELLGIQIDDFSPLQENQEITMSNLNENKSPYQVVDWMDCLVPTEAESIARFESGWPKRKKYSAITRNDYGEGAAYYIGVKAKEDFYKDLILHLMKEAEVEPILSSDQNVEVVRRSNKEENRELIFVINHSPTTKKVKLNQKYKDLISGKEKQGKVKIEPFQPMVLT